METRFLETSGFEAAAAPLYGLRWAAVLAGLVVGLGVHLLALLAGATAGFAGYGLDDRVTGANTSLIAALWDSVSLLVATGVGGYVAARASGLRRTADGVLHAVAVWGASLLCYALLSVSVAGSSLTGAFGMAASSVGFAVPQSAETSINQLLSRLERGDRAGAILLLRERFGLTPEQAGSVTERALTLFESAGAAPGADRATGSIRATNADDRTASVTGAWLSLVILLSLAAGAGGGLVGSRATLKRSRPGGYRDHRFSHDPVSERTMPTMG